MCRISSADCFISGFTASQSPQLRLRSIVGYTLLNGCLFCSAFSSKFSPATAGGIDCKLSLFNLPKDDKKAADIFSITDLKVSTIIPSKKSSTKRRRRSGRARSWKRSSGTIKRLQTLLQGSRCTSSCTFITTRRRRYPSIGTVAWSISGSSTSSYAYFF